jgi:hypothetical protein
LLGAVLNDIDLNSGSYYGGYGYYYYHYDAAHGHENGARHGLVDRLRGLVKREKEPR